jgi:hypothetical protein
MTILDAGYVTAKQTCTLFDVTLGECLSLAHFAEAVANDHGAIIPLRQVERNYAFLTRSSMIWA